MGKKRPSRGPSAAGALNGGLHALDEGLQCLALVPEGLALVRKRGHGLSVAAFGLFLLTLHEFTLELGSVVIGLHHARDAVVDNADLSGAYEDLGKEGCECNVNHFSLSR